MSDFDMEKFFSDFDEHSYEDWKNDVIETLKGVPFEKKMLGKSYEDVEIKAIYNKEDFEKVKHINSQAPGFYPFVRGTNAAGFLNKSWELCQELPYCLPVILNNVIKDEINKGTDSFSIKINGSESEFPIAHLFITDIQDCESAFNGVDLSKYPLYMDAGNATPAFATIFAAYCKQNNINSENVIGGFDFDPIGNLVKQGTIKLAKSDFKHYMSKYFQWITKTFPKMYSITIDGDAYHRGGANAIQEIAFSIATAVEYIDYLLESDFDIDTICSKIKFKIAIGNNFFMHIAKLRAARMIWAKIVKEYGGNEQSQKMCIHAFTSKRQSTKYDPYNNILRNTSRTFSAIAGNCDIIELAHFDVFHSLPNDFSRRISRNTQNVLKYEAHLTDTIDPAGGSWYIECLTQDFVEKIWERFQTVCKNDGILSELEQQIPQFEISNVAALRIKNLTTRKDVYIGANKYPNLNEKSNSNSFTISKEQIETHWNAQKSRLTHRNIELLNNLFSDLKINLDFDKAMEAALLKATVYEIHSCLTNNGNNYSILAIKEKREIKIFEDLRDAVLDYKELNGNFPQIQLFCFGPLKQYKPRADFATDFFQVGGFDCIINDGFSKADDAFETAKTLVPKVIVICSTDTIYEDVVPQFAKAIKEQNSNCKLVLAGFPEGKTDEYSEAGIDMFIHIKANIYEANNELHKFFGLKNSQVNQSNGENNE